MCPRCMQLVLEDGSWSANWQRIVACDDRSVLGCYLGAGAVRAPRTGTTVLEHATRSQRRALEDSQCEKYNKGRGKGSPEDNKDSHGKCGPVRIYADSLLDTRVFEIQKMFTLRLASSFKGDTTGISGIPVDIGHCIASGLLGSLGTFGYVPADEQIFVGYTVRP